MERDCADSITRIPTSRLLPAFIRECFHLARVPAPLSKSFARLQIENARALTPLTTTSPPAKLP